jgi:hypothetical protein
MAYPIKTLNRAVELGADRSLFDRNVTTYRNGERGIHHFSPSCVKLNNPNPLTTNKELLSLQDRVCVSCFEDSLSVEMRNTYWFVRQVISTINVVDRHLRDVDASKVRRATNTVGELEMLADDLESNVAEATERAGSGFASTIRNRIGEIRQLGTSNIEPFRAAVCRTAAGKIMSREHGTGTRAPFVTDADDTVLGQLCTTESTPTLTTVALYRHWLRHVYEHGDYEQARSAVSSLVVGTTAITVEQLTHLDSVVLAPATDVVSALQHAWALQRDARVERLVTMWQSTHQSILADHAVIIVGISGSWVPEDFAATITAVFRPFRYHERTAIAVPLVVARWFSQPGNGPKTTVVADPAIIAGRSLENVQKIAETAVTLWGSADRADAITLDEAVTTASLL